MPPLTAAKLVADPTVAGELLEHAGESASSPAPPSSSAHERRTRWQREC